MNPKYKQLRPDGAYGSSITGYEGDGKARFLRDARAVLKEAGQHLAGRGLTGVEVRANPAGPAVSGDAIGEYWAPDDPSRRAYVDIAASYVGWGRKDGVIIMARVQHYREVQQRGRHARDSKQWRMGNSDANQWLSANFNSLELADRVWQIFSPATSPTAMMAFTADGQQPIPGPIVHNDQEADCWRAGMNQVMQAFESDNQKAIHSDTEPEPIPLFSLAEIDSVEKV